MKSKNRETIQRYFMSQDDEDYLLSLITDWFKESKNIPAPEGLDYSIQFSWEEDEKKEKWLHGRRMGINRGKNKIDPVQWLKSDVRECGYLAITPLETRKTD